MFLYRPLDCGVKVIAAHCATEVCVCMCCHECCSHAALSLQGTATDIDGDGSTVPCFNLFMRLMREEKLAYELT